MDYKLIIVKYFLNLLRAKQCDWYFLEAYFEMVIHAYSKTFRKVEKNL